MMANPHDVRRSEIAAPGGGGRLPDGTVYFGTLGELAYDEDRVQCHLCGGWLKLLGGQHLLRAHGWTTEEYRNAFQLVRDAPTCSLDLSAQLSARLTKEIAEGRRSAPPRVKPMPPPTVGDWRSLASRHPDLLAEWHPDHNGDLDPSEIGTWSGRSAWWRCRTCGHEWSAKVRQRTAGYGCPACGRRRQARPGPKMVPRAQSLATLRPGLLAEWHPDRNGDLDPYQLAPATNVKAWWRCSSCGHEWRARVNLRAKSGCPQCARYRMGNRVDRERSLAALRPELLADWHAERNGNLDPYTIGLGHAARSGGAAASAGTSGKRPRTAAARAPAAVGLVRPASRGDDTPANAKTFKRPPASDPVEGRGALGDRARRV
jgi:predicted  nucleic acid-binding Zn-ribbon protein